MLGLFCPCVLLQWEMSFFNVIVSLESKLMIVPYNFPSYSCSQSSVAFLPHFFCLLILKFFVSRVLRSKLHKKYQANNCPFGQGLWETKVYTPSIFPYLDKMQPQPCESTAASRLYSRISVRSKGEAELQIQYASDFSTEKHTAQEP